MLPKLLALVVLVLMQLLAMVQALKTIVGKKPICFVAMIITWGF